MILFTNEDTLCRADVRQYLVLPIYTYQTRTSAQRRQKSDTLRGGVIPHTFHFPGHDPANCSLKDSYIDFTQMQTVRKEWFTEEYLRSFIDFAGARHIKNPICRLTPEYMDEIVMALENFLNNYLLVSGPDEASP
ncbi:MAG: hypothetical protein ACYC0L_06125 [Thermoleophilia bacterium]